MEAASVRLQFVITNLDPTTTLRPLCGPHGVWDHVRLLAGTKEVDDIPHYGRLHELHQWQLTSMEHRFSEAIRGYGGSIDLDNTAMPSPGTVLQVGGSITVSHKLQLSLFTSAKYIPLRYCPIDLECTIAPAANWLDPAGSQLYQISDVRLVYTEVSVDEAVQEGFYQDLTQGRSINIPTQQFVQATQSIAAGATSATFNFGRAFSRLAMVWVTFRGAAATSMVNNFVFPVTAAGGNVNTGAVPVFRSDQAPKVRLQIASKNWPDQEPADTVQQHWGMLQDALPQYAMIDRNQYTSTSFVTVFDLRRVLGDPSSAISTQSANQIILTVTGLTAGVATEMHITAWNMCVVACRENGVTILN